MSCPIECRAQVFPAAGHSEDAHVCSLSDCHRAQQVLSNYLLIYPIILKLVSMSSCCTHCSISGACGKSSLSKCVVSIDPRLYADKSGVATNHLPKRP